MSCAEHSAWPISRPNVFRLGRGRNRVHFVANRTRAVFARRLRAAPAAMIADRVGYAALVWVQPHWIGERGCGGRQPNFALDPITKLQAPWRDQPSQRAVVDCMKY